MSPASKTVGCIGYARERLHHPPHPVARLCSGQSGGLCHSHTQQSAQETPCHGSPRRHQDLPTLAETCVHIVPFQLFHCHLGPRSVHSQRHRKPLKRHELSVGHLSLQCLRAHSEDFILEVLLLVFTVLENSCAVTFSPSEEPNAQQTLTSQKVNFAHRYWLREIPAAYFKVQIWGCFVLFLTNTRENRNHVLG